MLLTLFCVANPLLYIVFSSADGDEEDENSDSTSNSSGSSEGRGGSGSASASGPPHQSLRQSHRPTAVVDSYGYRSNNDNNGIEPRALPDDTPTPPSAPPAPSAPPVLPPPIGTATATLSHPRNLKWGDADTPMALPDFGTKLT